MPATPPNTPSRQGSASTAELVLLVNNLSSKWDLGLELSHERESPQSRRSQTLTNGGECAIKCLSKIKYLYFKDKNSLFSALENFDEDAALLQHGWDSQPDARALSLKASNAPGTPHASQRRKLLDSLYSILDNTFQRVCLQKAPASFLSHGQENSDHGQATTPKILSNSEAKLENKRATQMGDGPHLFSTPTHHQRNHSTFTEPTSPQGQLPTRNLIAWIEAIPPRLHQPAVIGRPSIYTEKSPLALYPSLPVESHFSYDLVQQRNKRISNPSEAPTAPGNLSNMRGDISNSLGFLEPSSPYNRTESNFAEMPTKAKEFDVNGVGGSAEAVAKKEDIRFIASGSDMVNIVGRDKISEVFLGIFPKLPQCLEKVPFYIRYEITRIFLHAEVEIPQKLKLPQLSHLRDYNVLWNYLKSLPELEGKRFPERVNAEVWKLTSMQNQPRLCGVSMVSSLSFQDRKGKPPFRLELQPLSIDRTSRLSRRFGCDRFLKVAIPFLADLNFKETLKNSAGDWKFMTEEWISSMPHSFLGRTWQWFFVKDAPKKNVTSHTSKAKKTSLSKLHHHYFFATMSPDFRERRTLAGGQSLVDGGTNLDLSAMLRWLIPFEANKEQLYLKLFSRISLGLTRTRETIELQHSQILPRRDLLAANIVMNDGCGRLSREMAVSIRDEFGLVNTPSAYQGRIGGAKGLWLIDIASNAMEGRWIEVYSSQKKWRRDSSIKGINADDPAHRIFEVVDYSRPCKPANLNAQLIPLLESREIVSGVMRKVISNLLAMGMRCEVDKLKVAMENPELLRVWIQSMYPTIREKIQTEFVPYIGGLPQCTEEQINLLLDSGFQPNQLQYIRDGVRELLVRKLVVLKENLHITVLKSTNAFIGVDFGGYLKNDEVHLAFSRPFIDEHTGESISCLDSRDILVARAPAHLPSDIQRVKARFVPELMAIKDVAIFSTKGESPLAGKLSGGDYDGDRCWICWDEDLVNNFENFPVPEEYDFIKEGYLTKDADTYAYIQNVESDVVASFLRRSFVFNTQPNLLGECTNYKKEICRSGFPLESPEILRLCALIGELVDGPKQGTALPREAWSRIKKKIEMARRETPHMLDSSSHIINHLERVAKDAFDGALTEFKGICDECYLYDKDLVVIAREFQETACKSDPAKLILSKFKQDIHVVYEKWRQQCVQHEKRHQQCVQQNLGKSGNGFQDYVRDCSSMWQDIEPAVLDPQSQLFPDPWESNPYYSRWSLLKASLTFQLYYTTGIFPWWMCGQELCFLKAITTGRFNAVSKQMYGILKPDGAIVKLQQDMMLEGGLGDVNDMSDEYMSDGINND